MESLLLIVPIKNCNNLIEDFIKSIKLQTYKNWRVIFIDGNSDDKDYKSINKNQDKRFICIKQEKEFPYIYGAMNMGIELAKNDEWILFWGIDDRPYSNKAFSNLVRVIQKSKIGENKKNNLIISQARYFDLKNNKFKRGAFFAKPTNEMLSLKSSKFQNKLFWGECPPHQSTLFKINSLDFKYSLKYYLAADLDIFIKLSKIKNLKIITLNQNLVKIGDGGVSNRKNLLRFKEVYTIYKNYFKNLFFIPFFLRYLKKIFVLIK